MYHVSEACKYENDSYSITFTTDVAYTRDTNTLEYTLLSASRV